MKGRIFAACSVVICCALCGRSMASSQKRRYRIISALISAICKLRINIVERLESLSCALKNCDFPLFSAVEAILVQFSTPLDAWEHARKLSVKRGGFADCLGEAELNELDMLFEQLGKSGRVQQDLAISNCIAALEVLEHEEKRRYEETSKLYTTLGVLLGLIVAVLML